MFRHRCLEHLYACFLCLYCIHWCKAMAGFLTQIIFCSGHRFEKCWLLEILEIHTYMILYSRCHVCHLKEPQDPEAQGLGRWPEKLQRTLGSFEKPTSWKSNWLVSSFWLAHDKPIYPTISGLILDSWCLISTLYYLSKIHLDGPTVPRHDVVGVCIWADNFQASQHIQSKNQQSAFEPCHPRTVQRRYDGTPTSTCSDLGPRGVRWMPGHVAVTCFFGSKLHFENREQRTSPPKETPKSFFVRSNGRIWAFLAARQIFTSLQFECNYIKRPILWMERDGGPVWLSKIQECILLMSVHQNGISSILIILICSSYPTFSNTVLFDFINQSY